MFLSGQNSGIASGSKSYLRIKFDLENIGKKIMFFMAAGFLFGGGGGGWSHFTEYISLSS